MDELVEAVTQTSVKHIVGSYNVMSGRVLTEPLALHTQTQAVIYEVFSLTTCFLNYQTNEPIGACDL